MPHYSIQFLAPAAHIIHVEMQVNAAPGGVRLMMPTWIPGSYLIREFARHVTRLSATQNGKTAIVRKIDKATWHIDSDGSADSLIHVAYEVYAWDRSVRGCYFDSSRVFINPAALLLCEAANPSAACTVEIIPPNFPEAARWGIATTLPRTGNGQGAHFNYAAPDYDTLIDHPIEMGSFDEFNFEAGDANHRFIVSGKHRGDLERLKTDVRKICQGHCALFSMGASAPFSEYLFQLHVVDDGYGGLEHRDSTALICPRNHLPVRGDLSISEGYLELLGLISHEYFHAWTVKRIKPQAFTNALGQYDTQTEAYTRLLWLFEGITSYYDDLMLVRVGLLTEGDYLKLIGRRITQLLRTPGRFEQSLTEASFDAWIKYYRADENAPNSQVSYYLKGSLVALALDLTIRERSKNQTSLDDVMRGLWRDFGIAKLGVPEDCEKLFSHYANCGLQEFFDTNIYGTIDIDWANVFATFGTNYHIRPASNAADKGGRNELFIEINLRTLGIVLSDAPGGTPVIKNILTGSAAQNAGLSAGDTLVALDGLRANAATLGKHLARFDVDERLVLTYFRHDVLRSAEIVIPTPEKDTAWLAISEPHSERERDKSDERGERDECVTNRHYWLNGKSA